MRNSALPGLVKRGCGCTGNCNCKSSPMAFKGADSSNSSCWKGYKKVGTKKSPSGTGKTVNDCKKIK
jgi:hypothetical protein|tara:strand:- start:78 stop:278 length:201 start_codon:yes stop_codon:yes gene_type:complete